MPNDYITLKALAKELDTALRGARIDKIYQPERFSLTLSYRRQADKNGTSEVPADISLRGTLTVTCEPECPGAYISDEKRENPLAAPPFCMVLRKHLAGGQIESVSMLANDRILDFAVLTKSELGDMRTLHLLLEVMGRYSNILLVNGGKIIDAVKRLSYDNATKRSILPGMPYSPPENQKINCEDTQAVKKLLESAPQDGLAEFIFKNVSGLSKETLKKVLLQDGDPSSLIKELCDGRHDLFEGKSANEVFKSEISAKLNQDKTKGMEKPLLTSLKNLIKKNDKKITGAHQKLKECEESEELQKKGELILGNAYRYKNGDAVLYATDYEKEPPEEIAIDLEGLTPSEMSARLFKKYAKLKRTKEVVTVQLAELIQNGLYLESIKQSIATCKTTEDFREVAEELNGIKNNRARIASASQKKGRMKQKSGKPLAFGIGGYTMLLGKNNIQNDNLTFKDSARNYTWFHAKDYHGSHSVIDCPYTDLPDEVLTAAAEITAFYSGAKASDKTGVDYTLIKYVKRHPSGAAGMVTYTNQFTVFVKPDAHDELKKGI